MDLVGVAFPALWQGCAFVIVVPLLGWALRTAPWRRFDAGEPVHVWFGASFCLAGLWSIKASLSSGLVFHLLGVSLLTLLAGPRLALIGTAVVVAMVTALRDGQWANYALDVLAMGAVPVIVTAGALRAAGWLSPNPFIYIFVVGFFGAALAMFAAGILASVAVVLAGALPASVVLDQFLPYLINLAFGEATVTGMLVTLFIVYRPTWVATFDDAHYLRGR